VAVNGPSSTPISWFEGLLPLWPITGLDQAEELAPAVKREAEEDWENEEAGKGQHSKLLRADEGLGSCNYPPPDILRFVGYSLCGLDLLGAAVF
jgi:hypothetical protein